MYTVMYMSKLVRKQVYIASSQERRVKRRAKEEGVPEAEIVRRALDLGLERLSASSAPNRAAGKDSFFDLIDHLIRQGSVPGGRRWSREEIHDRSTD